ncbi:MAG: AMP-binding protein [Deltaproteobacteria bacterium]|uniref:AMP-binding protein n=1 Tax=Candidatus Zymogenus saltonus TaxID=2844893 RepID=A0A9D8KCI5_9DELT|nr:AMP-binding protein [Candidatus Zymogenus saltonus]
MAKNSAEEKRFWTKSYGRKIPDVDPKLFENNLLDLFKKSLTEKREKPAFVFMDVPVTFGELDLYSNRFANLLIKNGFKKGDVVGICLPNIPEFPIAWLGALKTGCVVSGVSPLLSINEMEHQIKDSEMKGFVTLDIIFAERVTKIAQKLPKLDLIVATNVGNFLPKIKRVLGKLLKKLPSGEVTPIEGKIVLNLPDVIKAGAYSDTAPNVKISPDDIALIMYTGGTTGVPKGALLSHRNNVAEILVANKYMEWEKEVGPVLSAFPMFHIAGMAFNEFSVYNGWTQLLLPDPRNTDFLCNILEKYRPHLIANVPSLYYLLLSNPKFRKLDHSDLAQCISAAAPFPVGSQKELESIIGKEKLIELYGMTETAAITVMNPIKGKKKLGTIGLPMINTDIKLVDPATGKEAKQGEPGELLIRCPQLMVGYFKNHEETKRAVDSEGYMHTGDVMVQDEDGYLTIVDRTKDMIIVSGFKVFSKKVEDIIATHPAVEIAATVGVPNPDRPGSEMVRAYLTLSPSIDPGTDKEALKKEILGYAKERLAPYEVPKEIEILSEMPLTSVGKLDKKVLRK